ncbi:AfsR/SARP family transcriptional regulator [Streptomyces sp. NBC_00503]|uniref:AfsR/SARP family transcriptional regulator n=1 Tax=Streptomyces sp. NBC_00503 TaxID=2903659 RepID=UPI002E823EDD|nr:AfsR/SARP family transcriptional regulator [Streptomyces sp. NBC_00503]WUD86543.1 AfsR/SARP family transcriptional regulator [Streptomyces sp. NBC_00503]
MKIQVLGALAVRENGISIAPTAPKPRQVLALLALHADQVVPVAALIEELWGDTPPRSARTTLQTYVLQLRALIATALEAGSIRADGTKADGTKADGTKADGAGPDATPTAKDVLVTLPGGYLLRTGGGTHDVREFDRLAGMGYRAMDAGDFPTAARLLREALSLWSGSAFADVQGGVQLDMEAKRLEETRLCALDQRIEADLRLGRHRELLAELTVLASRYRTHENLHGQFMLALFRSGRRGEALDVYQRLRATLVRELGLEPSAAPRRLQRSILMAGPDSLTDAAEPGGRRLVGV